MTAYDRRISDWSADLCSSDLQRPDAGGSHAEQFAHARRPYIARARHPEQQVVEKTGRAAEFPRPDSATVAVVGIAGGAIQIELDRVGVDQRRGDFAEPFLDAEATLKVAAEQLDGERAGDKIGRAHV